MEEDYLKDFMIINIEREFVEDIESYLVINEFCTLKNGQAQLRVYIIYIL